MRQQEDSGINWFCLQKQAGPSLESTDLKQTTTDVFNETKQRGEGCVKKQTAAALQWECGCAYLQSVLYWECQHALCQHGVRRVRAPHCSCVLGVHVSLLTRARDSRARSLCKRRLRQSAWTQASPVSSSATRTDQPAAGLACTCGVVAADVLGSLRCGCRKDPSEQRLNTDTTLSNSNFVFLVFTRRI